MAALADFDEALKRYHLAIAQFMKGDSEPAKELFSHQDDVTLANPHGGLAHGWEKVAEAMERAASSRRDGEATGFESWRSV
jgi:hypothetical protein